MSQALKQLVQALRATQWLSSADDLIDADFDQVLRVIAQVRSASGGVFDVIGFGDEAVADWVGPRLVFYPRARHDQLVGIASSRLGRRLDTQASWFTVFRAACAKLDRECETLFTAEATTTARFVDRAAKLFGVPVLSLVTPREGTAVADWLGEMQRLSPSAGSVERAYLSPPLSDESVASDMKSLPLRDRAVVAMSNRLLVFHLRKGGQLETLLRARLQDARWREGTVFVALGDGLVERDVADRLLDQGAVGWVVLDTLRGSRIEERLDCPTRQPAKVVPMPSAENWGFLTHCTRAQSSGWPDEDNSRLVDELLSDPRPQDRSALAALNRIIRTERLIATKQLVRGDVPVVSFTAVPLAELPAMRTYRSHLGRWDFEPYGICIRREWLEARGANFVRYGDQALWQELSADEQPFFQNNAGKLDVDWSLEREWRCVGDADLRDLSDLDAMVFVPSLVEADQLAKISRWPVTVLDVSSDPGAR